MKNTGYLNISQAASLLQVSKESLYKYARSGKIPAIKVGRHWRFDQQALATLAPTGLPTPDTADDSPRTPPVTPDKTMKKAETVLIIDDETLIRKLLSAWVEQAGYSVLLAATGGEAIKHLQTHPVAIMLLDLHLPDMTGDQVLNALPDDTQTRVVLITALPDSQVLDTALGHTIVCALTKPFSHSELMRVLSLAAQARP